MLKSLLISTFFCLSLLIPLSAEFVQLKGSNGQVVEFLIQSIEADGVMAQHRGSHKFNLVRWEQLDLDWLKQNQTDIWNQKQHQEAMRVVAYEEFKFGQSLSEVSQMIKALKGVRLPNEPFNETDNSVIWVTFKPKEMRQFLRFSFDGQDKLSEIELHTNFNKDDDIEAEMLAEWERLVQLVGGYETNAVETRSYPKSSEWRRWKSNSSADKQNIWLTHRWSDTLRQFELGLESKQISLSSSEPATKTITAFGTAFNTSTSTVNTNTNWVVYKSKLN